MDPTGLVDPIEPDIDFRYGTWSNKIAQPNIELFDLKNGTNYSPREAIELQVTPELALIFEKIEVEDSHDGYRTTIEDIVVATGWRKSGKFLPRTTSLPDGIGYSGR